MPFKFNPFTGNFDQTGSGGGGSSYIDGEVATYNDLPLDGTAALNSAWLVREASGIWPVSRKQAGIYIRTATAGSSRDADYTYAGTMPDVFSDAVLTIYDEASTTRTGQFNLGSITAGQNRVLTWPDGNGTIARTSDIPSTFAASAVTSGVFDNARINFASPSAIGSTTASSVAATTLSASSTVSGTGFSNYLASPPAIGGTSAAAGSFTTLSASTSLTLGTSGILSGGTNTIEQRNTTSAQTFRIYNTVSGAADANYERGFMRWSSNVLQIGTEAAGTGSGTRAIMFVTNGTNRWAIGGGGGSLVAQGAFPMETTGYIRAGDGATAGYQIGNSSFVRLLSSSAGILLLTQAEGTSDFNRLQFGGTTSSFPALKRSSTTLQVRLADDSAYSVLDAQLRAQGTAPATSGATGTAGDIRYDADYIYVCTAANTWKRAAIATW